MSIMECGGRRRLGETLYRSAAVCSGTRNHVISHPHPQHHYTMHAPPRGRMVSRFFPQQSSPAVDHTVTPCGRRWYRSASTDWNHSPPNNSHHNRMIRRIRPIYVPVIPVDVGNVEASILQHVRTRTRGLSTLTPVAVRMHMTEEEQDANHDDEKNNKTKDNKRDEQTNVQAQVLLDVFGEPVTFLRQGTTHHNANNDGYHPHDGEEHTNETHSAEAARIVLQGMADLDTFAMAVVSRGQSCREGNPGNGLTTKAAHSTALAHTRLLRHVPHPNSFTSHPSPILITAAAAPMMAVVGVAPLLCQGGVGYLSHLDQLLAQSTSPSIQLVPWARWAASFSKHGDRNSMVDLLSDREQGHLQALHYLLAGQHDAALATLATLLQRCPGDGLALSLAMDLCCTTGNKSTALRVAGSVAAYWSERGVGMVGGMMKNIGGQGDLGSIGSSLIALGWAVGGKSYLAESMAEPAQLGGSAARITAGGVASWALAHVYDAEGRTSEGISMLATYDGAQHYEGSGFLHMEARLAGYGARFTADRSNHLSALRLYDTSFERVLDYSGYIHRRPDHTNNIDDDDDATETTTTIITTRTNPQTQMMTLRAPTNAISETKGAAKSFFQNMFGSASAARNHTSTDTEGTTKAVKEERPTVEDVLTWMPPTGQFLADATMVLLQITLSGGLSKDNYRWKDLRTSWETLLEQQGDESLLFSIPIQLASSLLIKPPSASSHRENDSAAVDQFSKGLYKMGTLLNLGEKETTERYTEEEWRKEWGLVVQYLSNGRNGYAATFVNDDSEQQVVAGVEAGWDMDARPMVEHAIWYAATQAQDYESICVARSICSESVSLRSSSPQAWLRYSKILELLGDDVAADNARSASVAFGAGEGGVGAH